MTMTKGKDRELELETVDNEEKETFFFKFNAVQIVNRLLDVYGTSFKTAEAPSKKRLEEIALLFSEDAAILSLKTGKELLRGRQKIEQSFAGTSAARATCAKRLFIESSAAANFNAKSDADASVSFALDLHVPGTSPGLGDRTKHTVLLYRVESNLITHVWGGVDADKMSANEKLTKEDLVTKLKETISRIIEQDYPHCFEKEAENGVVDIHFHDYCNLEVWG